MSAIRTATPFALVLLSAYAWGILSPRAFPFAVVLGVSVAILGALRSDAPWVMTVIRSVILVIGTFGYALFSGGPVLPWIAAVVTTILLAAGWVLPPSRHEHIAFAQALAASLAVGMTSAATQFFFPTAWTWVAVIGVAAFLALLGTTPHASIRSPSESTHTLVLALVLVEVFIVLRALPMHWLIAGIILALTVATALDHARLPRAAFASLTVALLLFGVRS